MRQGAIIRNQKLSFQARRSIDRLLGFAACVCQPLVAAGGARPLRAPSRPQARTDPRHVAAAQRTFGGGRWKADPFGKNRGTVAATAKSVDMRLRSIPVKKSGLTRLTFAQAQYNFRLVESTNRRGSLCVKSRHRTPKPIFPGSLMRWNAVRPSSSPATAAPLRESYPNRIGGRRKLTRRSRASKRCAGAQGKFHSTSFFRRGTRDTNTDAVRP